MKHSSNRFKPQQPSLASVYLSRVYRLCYVPILMLACLSVTSVPNTATSSENPQANDSAPSQIATDSVPAEGLAVDGSNNVPRQALSADLLNSLLSFNFALYADEWKLGLDYAKSVALASKDPRLAKSATALAVQNKDYETGLEMAELWLTLDPSAQDGRNFLLLSQVNQGRIDEALAYLNKSDALSTDNIDSTIHELAGLLVQQTNSVSALAMIDEIVSQHPSSAQVQLSAAYVASAFGNKALAVVHLDRALEIRPGWESAALSKIELIEGPSQNETRMAFLKAFLDEYPDSVELRTVYAAELAKGRKLERALKEINTALKGNRRNVKALTYAALITTQMSDFKTAQKHYRRVIELESENEEALLALARFAERDQKLVSAREYYSRVLSDQNYAYAQIRLAVITAGEGELDRAIDDLSLLQAGSEAEFVEIAVTRHYLLMQARRFEEALGYINDSLLRLPKHPELHYARGLVAADLGNIALAEADFKAVLAVAPQNADALNAYGYTLADQTDRYQEALTLIESALALNPQAPHIIDSFGWVMFKLGELDVAREYLSRALKMSSEPEIAVHLGEVLWALQLPEQARRVWRDAQTQAPDSVLLRSTLERLEVDLDE